MQIDLNSDLGEGYGAWLSGDDEGILKVVSSANLACGGHAADPLTMLKTLRLAKSAKANIGAQVSYPDILGFGRRDMIIEKEELFAHLVSQCASLSALAKYTGSKVSYIKPHGALYHAISKNEEHLKALMDTALLFNLPLLLLANSPALKKAQEKGITVYAEAFADRAYQKDGSLVPRSFEGSVIHDLELVCARMIRLVQKQEIESLTGELIKISAQSLCLHSDTKGALALAVTLKKALEGANCKIQAFIKEENGRK